MDLTKIAQLMKEASAEIRKLKEENAQLRAQIEKTAGDVGPAPVGNSDVFGDSPAFGFGSVANDEYVPSPNNPRELVEQIFGKGF